MRERAHGSRNTRLEIERGPGVVPSGHQPEVEQPMPRVEGLGSVEAEDY